jgi:hypothetical protein
MRAVQNELLGSWIRTGVHLYSSHINPSFTDCCARRGEDEVMPEVKELIQPAPVVRDEYGMFQHPDMPDFDEGDEEKCKIWIADQGLQVKMVSLEYHSDEAVSERYFEAGEPDCSYWEPDMPDGEGWFCLAIHDADDGPVCWWARRVVAL